MTRVEGGEKVRRRNDDAARIGAREIRLPSSFIIAGVASVVVVELLCRHLDVAAAGVVQRRLLMMSR